MRAWEDAEVSGQSDKGRMRFDSVTPWSSYVTLLDLLEEIKPV